jgi:hypothetical protein
MFCPKCATQNLDGASFCRSCGANISLVPQALSGQLPQPNEPEIGGSRRGRKHEKPLTLDHAFKSIFMGIAFLLVAIALSRSTGQGWWFWMLIPAFSMMGSGVAQFIRIREREKRTMNTQYNQPVFTERPNASFPNPAQRRPTGELMPPVPSVTEGTTRHLGTEASTRHLDTVDK